MKFSSGDLYLDVLVIIISFVVVTVGYFQWSFAYWKRKAVYTLSPSIPFGNAANLIFQKASLGVELRKNYDEFKKRGLRYGGFYFFSKPIFIPVDLDLVKTIMTKDFEYFTDRIFYTNSEAEPLTGHIFFLKRLRWKPLRTKLKPSYSPAKIKMIFQTLLDCTKDLVVILDDAAEKGEAVDVKDVISRFMIDVTGSCAFGIQCNSLRNPEAEFRKYGTTFFDSSFLNSLVIMVSTMAPEILYYFRFRTIRKDVADFFMNVVQETVNYREKNKIVRNDLLQILIQLKDSAKVNDEVKKANEGFSADDDCKAKIDKQQPSLTLEELTAQCFGFFLAGYETSSTTVTYCLYELAKNTKIQDRLQKEIQTVLARHKGEISYESISEMIFMERCINETFRKYSPVPMFTRKCTKTYQVPNSNVVIEKNTSVFIPSFAIQRDPEFYPEAEKFDPERFAEDGKASKHPSSWMPFGDGPRICIAPKLGLVQVKVGLAVLLKDYRFTLNPKTPSSLGIDPRQSFITTPKGQIWVDVKKLT